MITAAETREETVKVIGEETLAELDYVEKHIRKYTSTGRSECYCNSNLHDYTIELLRSLGYKVLNCSDQKDGVSYKISW